MHKVQGIITTQQLKNETLR